MDEMGHTNPAALALRVYRQAMRRDDDEKVRSERSWRAPKWQSSVEEPQRRPPDARAESRLSHQSRRPVRG
jgi:hypothetical protein